MSTRQNEAFANETERADHFTWLAESRWNDYRRLFDAVRAALQARGHFAPDWTPEDVDIEDALLEALRKAL